MVSWSLLTVHIILKIALQLMQGLYDGQQRPLTSNETQKIKFRKFLDFIFRNQLTIWFDYIIRTRNILVIFPGRVKMV